MAKHTYGFVSGTDKGQATEEAVKKARENGFIDSRTKYDIDIVETLEHKKNNEFCVVIRTDK